MSKIINSHNDYVEKVMRETELVEEYLDVNDYEESNSLIRMEMNVIEFPIFSKNPRVKKNQILKYYFSKDKKEFLEITPPPNEAIPNEFDERVFISLLKIMKKKGNKAIFYCTATEIVDGLNVSAGTKRGLYGKIRTSVLKLSKTNYSFSNLFYAGELSGRVNDLINTPLLTSRIITLKDSDNDEKKLFSDKRIKEFYRIRISDDIYNNITNKGYLVFDADVLLSIGDPIVRSLYTQITKWRFNQLYLKKPLVYVAKKIPLSLKGRMLYKTVEKINDSFTELKDLGLISDFNYLKNKKVDKSEFEIFFSPEHNKFKQRLFYQDKEDYNNLIHSVEERLNNYPDNNVSSKASEILIIFGIKGSSLKTLPNVVKEALKSYEFDYVKYTAEYTALNAKASILKYFKDALANNWADEYIARKKAREVKQNDNRKEVIEDAIIVEMSKEEIKAFTWEEFEELPLDEQAEIDEIAYESFLMEVGGFDTKINKNIYEKSKKSLILKQYTNFIKLKNLETNEKKSKDPFIIPEKINNHTIFNDSASILMNTTSEKYFEKEEFPSLAKFCNDVYSEVKKVKSDASFEDVITSIKLLGEYEDEYIIAKYNESLNYAGYRIKQNKQ